MSEKTITILSEFLVHSGAKYRIFDMGRRITKVSSDEFHQFENALQPYPYPFQQSALFGVIFWNPKLADTQYVWFLKFPLDEQGLLLQAARDEFLVMLLDRVGECMLAASDGKSIEGALKDSPYTFKPREDRMAGFNAHATKALATAPSQYYYAAQDYFSGVSQLDSWQTLGMQGVADVATRINDMPSLTGLVSQLADMPEPPFMMLCTFLENSEPPTALVEKMQELMQLQLNAEQPNLGRICAYLRAVSNSPAHGIVDDMVMTVLQHPASLNIEVLAIISGRIWRVLQQEAICQSYLEQLAHNSAAYEGFSHLLTDAIYLPGLRNTIMQGLRSANRSDKLAASTQQMFGH